MQAHVPIQQWVRRSTGGWYHDRRHVRHDALWDLHRSLHTRSEQFYRTVTITHTIVIQRADYEIGTISSPANPYSPVIVGTGAYWVLRLACRCGCSFAEGAMELGGLGSPVDVHLSICWSTSEKGRGLSEHVCTYPPQNLEYVVVSRRGDRIRPSFPPAFHHLMAG